MVMCKIMCMSQWKWNESYTKWNGFDCVGKWMVNRLGFWMGTYVPTKRKKFQFSSSSSSFFPLILPLPHIVVRTVYLLKSDKHVFTDRYHTTYRHHHNNFGIYKNNISRPPILALCCSMYLNAFYTVFISLFLYDIRSGVLLTAK